MYVYVYNGMMGVILLTIEFDQLSLSPFPPTLHTRSLHNDNGWALHIHNIHGGGANLANMQMYCDKWRAGGISWGGVFLTELMDKWRL